jgi:hypothetical protein
MGKGPRKLQVGSFTFFAVNLDMEAFKAANPGCVLGDFIRWHSPKDWVEDTGEISKRMADAGNYWQELWAVRQNL